MDCAQWCGLQEKFFQMKTNTQRQLPLKMPSHNFFLLFFLPKQSSRSLKAIPAAASFEMVTLRANKFGFEKTSNGTKLNGSLK